MSTKRCDKLYISTNVVRSVKRAPPYDVSPEKCPGNAVRIDNGLTFRNEKGKYVHHKCTEYQVKTAEFFATHPVFSLDEATTALAPTGGRSGTVERLKYHLKSGTLKLAARGVYAVVPPGGRPNGFSPIRSWWHQRFGPTASFHITAP